MASYWNWPSEHQESKSVNWVLPILLPFVSLLYLNRMEVWRFLCLRQQPVSAVKQEQGRRNIIQAVSLFCKKKRRKESPSALFPPLFLTKKSNFPSLRKTSKYFQSVYPPLLEREETCSLKSYLGRNFRFWRRSNNLTSWAIVKKIFIKRHWSHNVFCFGE